MTTLIGREQDISTLCSLLQQPTTRLVTLHGPGGVGKTQLALQVAAALSETFADGVAFVSLASITTAELLIASIAHALGIKERREALSLELLKKALHDKEILLLLDNFEQLLSAAPLLTELLLACPDLKLLVTSRAILRLQAEYRFPIAPLLLPDLAHLPDYQTLSEIPAVALFVERSHRIYSTFHLTPANVKVVAEMCVLLDGLPLALELATARMKLFTPQELLNRLKQNLALLQREMLDVPARQHTLFATMQWSYHLLTPQEQQFFRRLCVFRDGCTFEAAEAVSGHGIPDESDALIDIISSLVDQSLLQVQSLEEEPRLVLLETIRAYGLECLKQSGEEEEIREAHARYYLTYVEQAAPRLMSTEQTRWYQCLDCERENIRAALNWFIASGNEIAALRMNIAIWLFWAQLHLAEGYQWMERALALNQKSTTNEDLSIQAHAHSSAAALAYYMGNWQRASMHLDQCVQIFRRIDDKAGLAVALNTQALLALEQEDYAALPTLVEEALALKQYINAPWYIAETLYVASMRAYIQKDYQRASALAEEALAYCRKAGEPSALALASNALGLFAYARRDEQSACTWYYESLQAIGPLEKVDAISLKTASLVGLAGIAAERGHYRWAAQLWGAVEALRKRSEGTIGDTRRRWLNTATRRQSNYDHLLQMAQAQLGKQAFSVAWNEGQTMTIEQLLAPYHRLLLSSAKTADEAPPTNRPEALTSLTTREIEVLRLMAQGHTSAQIAQQLVISILTVNSHVRSIYSKLGIASRAAATRYAIEHHLL